MIGMVAVISGQSLQAQESKEPVKVTDMLKIKTVGDIHLSPDGRLAVFTLLTIEPDTAGKTGKWDYKYLKSNEIRIYPSF